MRNKRDKLRQKAFDDDVEWAWYDDTEAFLEEAVRYYWLLTRKGPHDECLCYEFYRMDLKEAIHQLRLWRSWQSH